MKVTLSHGAYAELQRRAANRDHVTVASLFDAAPSTLFGMQFQTSSMFPYRQTCGIYSGTGDGGEQRTYCHACSGGGGHIVEGIQHDRNNMIAKIFTKRLPPRFAVSFPANVSVPAAPMRGRIKEVRL